MFPWLVIPLIGLWFLSQFLPPAFRFEIMSPRLACVFVLLITLFWYEILMPQLSAWQLRRNARLRERKRFEAIEMQKLRKTATRRCRNCLTPYRDQNPGGGKFMCSYCGHISKRPVLDLPVLPGLGLSNSGILKDLVGKGGKMLNGNGQYHQFEMDTRILQELGIKAYRFSISWPRILPNGRIGNLNKGVNKEGVAYYNNLINALKARDIEPYVTLFHWDLPQALDDKYGGFLSESIRDDFKNYADFCFKEFEFGDRVKHWCTINEPYVFSWGGYALGTLAPGHGYPPTKTISNTRQLANPNAIGVSNKFFRQIETMVKENHPQWIRTIPPSIGDAPPTYSGPATEPYVVGYNLLLCHAVAYNLYQQKYKKTQGGKVGLTLNSHWFQAQDESSQADKDAAQRELDFMLGWFMKPLATGQYPDIMMEYVQDRLPSFTEDEAKLVMNSFDFIGINYYTAYTVVDDQALAQQPPHFVTDPRADMHPLGQKSNSAWIYVYPEGIKNLLNEIKKYGDQIQIYVTENGIDQNGDDPNLSQPEYIWDDMRVNYHHDHLSYILQAMIRDDVKVKGYFTWSFLDSFEFSSANDRFGNCFVDYDNNFQRTPKFSASWYKFFLQNGQGPIPKLPVIIGLIGNDAEVNQAGIKRKNNGSEVASIVQGSPKRQNNGV